MNSENVYLYIGLPSWIISWIILAFKLDLITYLAFMFYGLGLSGITLYFAFKYLKISK